MRVLVAGATGAMGKQLMPRLADAGHEVFAMIRRESDKAKASQLGAVPVIADALDRARSRPPCARRRRRWSSTS